MIPRYINVIDDGGFTFGMDEVTPVTFRFTQRPMVRGVYTRWLVPAGILANPDFSRWLNTHTKEREIVCTLHQLKAWLRPFLRSEEAQVVA